MRVITTTALLDTCVRYIGHMPDLDQLAAELGVSGRTLRRAAARQSIRVTRVSPRVITITASEHHYILRHWTLFERALQVLRTRLGVRLAVLFGSAARGESNDESDVDMLVRVRGGWSDRVDAALALEEALSRPVQLVDLASAPPLLLSEVLRDGRVLADRDGDWERLQRRAGVLARAAETEAESLEQKARQALDALAVP